MANIFGGYGGTIIYLPKEDNWGWIGSEQRRIAKLWAVNLYTEPKAYTSDPMTGHETFTYPKFASQVYFLNPNGTDRNFNPSGDFSNGFTAFIKNIGTSGNIVFDSDSSKQIVSPGQLGIMLYDGDNDIWR